MPNTAIFSKNKFTPFQSTIILSTTIVDLQRKEGKTGFQLIASASIGQVFHEEIRPLKAEYCFVYKATNQNTATKAEFVRVATIRDLKDYSTAPGQAGDLYRSNTFSEFFNNIADTLANKSLLRVAVYQLTSDLNNIYGYAAYEQIDETVVLPTYIEGEVDGMIETLNGYKYKEQEIAERIKLINTVTLPLLEYQKNINIEQFDIMDKLYATTSNFSVDLPTLDNFGKIVDTLASDMAAAKDSLDDQAVQVAEMSSHIVSLENTLTSAFVSSNKGSIGTEIDSALRSTSILKSKSTNIPVNSFTMPTTIALSAKAGVMKRVSSAMKNFNMDVLVAQLDMETVLNMLRKQRDRTITHIEEAKTELVQLKNDREQTRRKIQEIEVELRRRIPTLDLENPQSFWAVKVNVQ